MKNLGDTFFGRMLGRLADLVLRRPQLFVWPQVALAVACVVYTACFLKIDTNRDNLVGTEKKHHQIFLKYKKEFPATEDLVVVVEGNDAAKNRQFIERIGAKLEAETNLYTDVFYKGDLKLMGHKALLFAQEKDLVEMRKMLGDYRPFVEQFARTTNLYSFFNMVNTQFRTAKREQGAQTESLIKALPALERIVKEASESLPRTGVTPSPGVSALFGAGEEAEQQIYITFARGRLYLATAKAKSNELNNAAVKRLRVLVEETRTEVPGLNVGLTGGPVLDHDEMRQSERDTVLASIVSLVICALIFIYGYQETGRPVKATLCLLVGLAYTLGFTTLAIGYLNVLTITFLPILIGLAIDFGVHLVTRYEEELRRGLAAEAALRKAMIYTGQGIFTGAFTTAGAFLAMGFTDFKGIQEMGIISGMGILICFVPMMTMLPVLLLRGRQNRMNYDLGDALTRRARIEQIWLRRPVLVAVVTLGLCGLAWTQFRKVYFDYDLLNMQSAGLSAVIFEKKLISAGSNSVLFAAVVADTPQDAAVLEAKISQLPTVSKVESMSRFIAEDQTRKLALVREIKQEVTGIYFPEIDSNPVNVAELSRTLWSLQGYLGLAAEAVGNDNEGLKLQLVSFRDSITAFRKRMLSEKPDFVAAKLAGFQQALFNDIQDTFQAIRDQDARQALRAEDLPAALRNRFVGITGKYLLQVYPRHDVWQRVYQKEFVNDLRQKLDPKDTGHPIITGTPVQLYEYTSLLKESYQQAAWYSLITIIILVLVHFRNISSVILVLIPVAVGSIWLGGIMGFFNIPFNPANIMTLPLVIGIGVTNGIHILNRFVEERTPSILAKSTGKAVLVSGLTAIAGFGSLIFAKHQGIQSLGYVMSVGVATCMIAALTFLTALLTLSTRHDQSKKQPSADNARSTLG